MSHHHHHHCPVHGHQCCSCCSQHTDLEPCCTCHHTHHEQGDFANKLLEMADQAWMELLKEKIKEQIVASNGNKLDELAKIVAESNDDRWQQKLALLDIAHNFTDKVRTYFSRKKAK